MKSLFGATVLFTCALGLVSETGLAQESTGLRYYARAKGSGAKVYTLYDTKSEVLRELGAGSLVGVYDDRAGFYEVEVPGGMPVWVYGEYLREVANGTYEVTGSRVAERIARAFGEMQSLPGVARARWLGMIGALDLEGDTGYLARAGWSVYQEARRRGAYLRPMGNVVYVAPSLNIPDPDLDELLAIVGESVEAAGRARIEGPRREGRAA